MQNSNTVQVSHLALIMDGNRRWAQTQGLHAWEGHEHGYRAFQAIVRHAFNRGVAVVTVYAFSSENWSRTADEVGILMSLFMRAIDEQSALLREQEIRIRFIGDRSAFSKDLQDAMERVESESVENTRGILNIALNYGGREELVRATQDIVRKGIAPEEITEDVITAHLTTAGLPDPDLVIRTSGEQRLSGFLPWQSVYSELYFTNVYWPDFDEAALDEALAEYGRRQRRFGV